MIGRDQLVAPLMFVLLLASCGPLRLPVGVGGPNVAANVQAGQTNSQTLGQSSVTTQKLVRPQAGRIEQSGANTVKADTVQAVTVNNRIPLIYWVALIIAILIDSPARWPGEVVAAFQRR